MVKLLALPVVVLAVVLAQWMHPLVGLRGLLWAKLALLGSGAGLAVALGPVREDSWQLVAVGSIFVFAMGVQNALQRVDFPDDVPGTVMTGAVTQVARDLVERIRGSANGAVRERLGRTMRTVAVFALGCASAALAFGLVGSWCFVLAPIVGFVVATSTFSLKRSL